MITMQDVAAKSGVSPTTVSFVLNGRDGKIGISSKTRQRVLETARELGYDASHQVAARRLASRKHGNAILNRTICLFLPDRFQEMSYFNRVIQGIFEITRDYHFDVITVASQSGKTEHLPQALQRGEVDGVLLCAYPSEFEALLGELQGSPRSEKLPLISLMHPLPNCFTVRADERQGAYQVAKHLLDLGHRHIMHCYGAPRDHGNGFHALNRIAGYEQAMSEQGLNPSQHLHGVWFYWDVLGEPLDHRGDAMLAALEARPEITAVMTINDRSARALSALLRREGKQIPRDYSIVGFDDTDPLLNDDCLNILTTVHLPLEEIGRRAGRLLIERILQSNAENAIQSGSASTEMQQDAEVVLPVMFVERASTAPPHR